MQGGRGHPAAAPHGAERDPWGGGGGTPEAEK